MHAVKTSIVTDHAGQITGYGITVEAETNGDPEEIQAAITASLEMIRAVIATQIADQADPPAGHAPAAPNPELAAQAALPTEAAVQPKPQPDQPATNGKRQPPATLKEAETRFYARYATLIGGKTWSHVRSYLGTKGAAPKTIQEWIDVAQLVYESVQQ
jgi:hypothetical protein